MSAPGAGLPTGLSSGLPDPGFAEAELTRDALLGGRVRLLPGQRPRQTPRPDPERAPLRRAHHRVQIGLGQGVGHLYLQVEPRRHVNGCGDAHAGQRAAAHHAVHVGNGGAGDAGLCRHRLGKHGGFHGGIALQAAVDLFHHHRDPGQIKPRQRGFGPGAGGIGGDLAAGGGQHQHLRIPGQSGGQCVGAQRHHHAAARRGKGHGTVQCAGQIVGNDKNMRHPAPRSSFAILRSTSRFVA